MNTEHYKAMLLEEKKILLEEIESLGVMKISNEDFSSKAEEGVDSAENLELANMFEVEQTKDAILDQLENRLMDVERALSKIESATYGLCEISGESIEEERLEANPAARTCIAHREEVLE
jgi:DnaK suppressor protein